MLAAVFDPVLDLAAVGGSYRLVVDRELRRTFVSLGAPNQVEPYLRNVLG